MYAAAFLLSGLWRISFTVSFLFYHCFLLLYTIWFRCSKLLNEFTLLALSYRMTLLGCWVRLEMCVAGTVAGAVVEMRVAGAVAGIWIQAHEWIIINFRVSQWLFRACLSSGNEHSLYTLPPYNQCSTRACPAWWHKRSKPLKADTLIAKPNSLLLNATISIWLWDELGSEYIPEIQPSHTWATPWGHCHGNPAMHTQYQSSLLCSFWLCLWLPTQGALKNSPGWVSLSLSRSSSKLTHCRNHFFVAIDSIGLTYVILSSGNVNL